MDSPGPQDSKDDHGDPDSTSSKSAAQSGSPSLPSPSQIGPYKIRELIGEGGMGIVYLAEQIEPVRRRVALKVIKLGMDTKEVVARFEAERQALAMMDHPNIAKVFDAGSTEEGRPYFVMEHVAGVPITEYCDTHRLTTRERVRLFIEVCDAIHHAHQNAIIHRDVKASNVLVKVQDDKPHPKIIDFGVAKAIHHRLTEKTVFTEQGQLIGTPAYMSPEQAEMTGLNIDPRTDIYSLGVLFYELLAGHLPFDPRALREAGLEGIRRFIRDVDPPKPSIRISSLGDGASEVAVHRGTVPPVLEGQLRGDLDWITMRAMEKDRTRRYQSASEFAADIERYLHNEPVLAGPPSLVYRAQKLVRRHRAGVGVAIAAVLVSLAFLWQHYQMKRTISETPPDATVGEIPQEPRFHKIRIPANPGNGILSPDGKSFAFISQASVWVVPIPGKVQPDLAGAPVRLTEPMDAREWSGNYMSWSKDGNWLAFNAYDGDDDAIFVIPTSRGRPNRINVPLYRGGGHPDKYRISLSPDGKILAFTSKSSESSEEEPGEKPPLYLYTIPVRGGNATCLTTEWSSQPAFSPIGDRIAFVKGTYLESGEDRRDLWVINADGSEMVKLTDFPGRVRGPVWSPDGRLIAVNLDSDSRNRNHEIWVVPAPQNGIPAGSPIKIDLPLESSSMIAGWTVDNKIGLLMTSPAHQAVYTVPASGGKATQVTPEDPDGYPCYPKWSPDGETLYFRWGRGNIASVPYQGGRPQIVHHAKQTKIIAGIPGAGNGLSPDGKTIVFMAYKEGTHPVEVSIWTVPVGGGEPTEITRANLPRHDRFPCWSPDGDSIAFGREDRWSKDEYQMNIFLTSSEGGEVRQLTSRSNRVTWASIDWSPDGEYIAYFSLDDTINIIPVRGGEHRVLADVGNVSGHCSLSWSPDGTELAYTSMGRLMVVSLGGGEPREVETGVLGEGVINFHIDWSPDGKEFVFTAGFGGAYELWLMDDFLDMVNAE
jgi:serine/threonine protein kinase